MKIIINSFLLMFLFIQSTIAQNIPKDWHLLDEKDDGYWGISLNKAIKLLDGKKRLPVVIAVIDTGIDTTHEELKPILWTNCKEIPGNGIDDDKNGYTDDLHGWNFLGNNSGKNVINDSYEFERTYFKFRGKFENFHLIDSIADVTIMNKYQSWKNAEKKFKAEISRVQEMIHFFKEILEYDSTICKALNKLSYNKSELEKLPTTDSESQFMRTAVLTHFNQLNITENKQLQDWAKSWLKNQEKLMLYLQQPPIDYRGQIVKDDYNSINDKFYGNADIMTASNCNHGTHVVGIIRTIICNEKSYCQSSNGIRIMFLRALVSGTDEHDKDIALAIRYAVDNGAKIINMSFAKSISPEKELVDEAIEYAEEKDVLIIHAAGNDSEDLDSASIYPSGRYLNGKRAKNFISVGASADNVLGSLVSKFSNYGKNEVDVFAPGVRLYTAHPGNTFEYGDGTSLAAPIVSGIAALLISYFPNLSAQQMKFIIEKSVVKPKSMVTKPGTNELVGFSELSKTGGIINAFELFKLAKKVYHK